MPSSSFFAKQLRITITLGENAVPLAPASFPGTNDNQLILTGAKASIEIEGHVTFPGQLMAKIYGMKRADMDALTIPWGTQGVGTVFNNTILIEAINQNGTFSQIFFGQMIEAMPKYNAMPDVYFQVLASILYDQQIANAPSSSYPQVTPVEQIVGELADKMGITFNNQGVTATVSGTYLSGTLMDQLRLIADASNIDWFINAEQITICPRNAGRNDLPVLNITPDNGLLGYPEFSRSGLMIDVLFDPVLQMQQQINISGSKVPAANGTWSIIGANTRLDTFVPDGDWIQKLQLVKQSIQGGF